MPAKYIGERVHFIIGEDIRRELDRLAEKHGGSRSLVIRAMCKAGVTNPDIVAKHLPAPRH